MDCRRLYVGIERVQPVELLLKLAPGGIELAGRLRNLYLRGILFSPHSLHGASRSRRLARATAVLPVGSSRDSENQRDRQNEEIAQDSGVFQFRNMHYLSESSIFSSEEADTLR